MFMFNYYLLIQVQFYCVTVASFVSNNKFKCKKCGRMYQTKNSLKSHVEVICGKLPQFKCDLCNQKTFKQKGNYKLHLLLLLCSRKYVCPTPNCNRSYSNKSSVRQHLRFECQKEPQFYCIICSKQFFRKTSLKSHMGIIHKLLDV
ncbi:longitudinals lacking protein, isoforms A/B/D/L-like isoform X40 [Aphis craccivora]|uniref:Longitudinals lacking protein, isoforms A/B/D/L-like isoform X40 n=1 Tax=Aphis craccivora TaxID=307492 RepID=A0A6G0YZV6_APHCR|nr:longitudinals lacking protein, isoforms A/B/D/L-like isoform X40 [Aphis craccivora]